MVGGVGWAERGSPGEGVVVESAAAGSDDQENTTNASDLTSSFAPGIWTMIELPIRHCSIAIARRQSQTKSGKVFPIIVNAGYHITTQRAGASPIQAT
jgi:hypothetical protein